MCPHDRPSDGAWRNDAEIETTFQQIKSDNSKCTPYNGPPDRITGDQSAVNNKDYLSLVKVIGKAANQQTKRL